MGKLSSLIKNATRAVGLSFHFLPSLTIGAIVISCITGLAPLFQAKILGDIVNSISRAATHTTPIGAISGLVILYASVWAGIRFLAVLELFIMKLWRDGAQHAFDLMIFRKRTEIDLGHYENPSFQSLMLRAFSQGTSGPLIDIVINQVVIFSTFAVIIVSSLITSSIGWNVYSIILVCSIPSFVVQVKYGHKVWGIWAEHSERQKMYSSMRSHIVMRTGITQIKLLQNAKRVLQFIDDALTSFKHDNNKLDRERFMYQTGAAILSAVGFGISLSIIVSKVVKGELSVGTLVFIVSALGSLVGSINTFLARLAGQIERNLYLSDIYTVLDTRPFVQRPQNPKKLALSSPPIIEFLNVSFKYQGREDWILKNVNLVIKPSEKVALVGMNGAGKSTLIKLLSRIYDPSEGEIRINGVDLKQLDLDEWSSYLSVLLQDYMTYELPAKESIAMSRISEPLSVGRVIDSSKFSGADEFIETWENKYDQKLGKEFEGGIEPSKGQQQKLALARTVYRNALIMVLDEPTAAIDALSEMSIFEQMEEAVGKNTLIVITHRFNTTQSLDKIVVLDKGTVAEIGTHQELLTHGGLYKEMFDSQAKAFREEEGENSPVEKKRKPKRKAINPKRSKRQIA